jgi:hypothetical protein
MRISKTLRRAAETRNVDHVTVLNKDFLIHHPYLIVAASRPNSRCPKSAVVAKGPNHDGNNPRYTCSNQKMRLFSGLGFKLKMSGSTGYLH